MTGIIILIAALAIALFICWLILRSVRAGSVRIDVETRDPAPANQDPENPQR
ncbi:hypothetical protein [Nocardia concava]|uniref:hypothetical protein n=1 Tax=Nocardia concava TaxID=257281 RepID=UPI0002E7D86F|nr:hypothetical protein [Nocardia concava]